MKRVSINIPLNPENTELKVLKWQLKEDIKTIIQ